MWRNSHVRRGGCRITLGWNIYKLKHSIYCKYTPIKPDQSHVIIIFILSFFIFWFIDWLLLSLFLNSDVTLSPTLLCVSPLTQTLQILLLYGILIVINRLQPSHLFFFSPINFSIVLSPQIDRYGLQWYSFLNTRDREWL